MRTKTGSTTIDGLERAAKVFGSELIPIKSFVEAVFEGDDTEEVLARKPANIVHHPLSNGSLTRYEVMAYAEEWDGWGPSDIPSFVDALACNTLGSNKGDAVADLLQAMSFMAAASLSEDGNEGHNIDYEFGSEGNYFGLPRDGGLCNNEALDRAGW